MGWTYTHVHALMCILSCVWHVHGIAQLRDHLHGVDVVLSEADVALIRRLQRHRYPDPNLNPYPEAVHYEYADKLHPAHVHVQHVHPHVHGMCIACIHRYADKLHPLSSASPRKASFIPSKWEAKKVMRLVMAMRSEQCAPGATHS